MLRRSLLVACLIAPVPGVVGCGGGTESPRPTVDPTVVNDTVTDAIVQRRRYCALIRLRGITPRDRPRGLDAERDRAARDVDRLISLVREDPDRPFTADGGSRSLRQVVADEADRYAVCDANLSGRLTRALTALPNGPTPTGSGNPSARRGSAERPGGDDPRTPGSADAHPVTTSRSRIGGLPDARHFTSPMRP